MNHRLGNFSISQIAIRVIYQVWKANTWNLGLSLLIYIHIYSGIKKCIFDNNIDNLKGYQTCND